MSSRREFIQNCKIGVIALTTNSLTSCLLLKDTRKSSERAGRTIQFNQDWLFGGEFKPEMLAPDFNDVAFSKVTLPHSVVKLPWRDWNPADWQKEWIYRKHFRRPVELKGMRVFLHFDGVMVGAEPTINGHNLPQHMGGYLPFNYEITDWLSDENLLSVKVDSRWSNVPPQGAEMGAKRIDYMEPGGIHRSVRLEAVPQNFISDVFAKPVRVLKSDRAVDITCTLDLAVLPKEATSVQVKMKKGDSVVASSIKKIDDIKPGKTEVALSLTDLKDVTLWDVDNPFLYDIEATLLVGNQPLHDFRTRTGLREARFELDGFYLNGRRLQIFGLNRHEIYPYVGFALPDRVMRRDAWILKKEFNCNTVRCSHYPQTEAFLDACDELGLLVWEEIPGWGYLGDDAWKKLVLRDVKDMILRDRNHPSIFIWGTRVNESANEVELYKQTKALAKQLDDSRASAGSMVFHSTKNWDEDVFAFDDYHSDKDKTVGIQPPLEGVPYMLAEAVGQFNYAEGKGFTCMYRRDTETRIQQLQAICHAQAHNKAAMQPRNCGVIGWCAFEYSSLHNSFKGIKNPGVADVFRIPKLGASFYQSQCDPEAKPVISPNFHWDFGPKSPNGPGEGAAIFSNCDQLEIFIDNTQIATLQPDKKNYPKLKHAPFFTNLRMDGSNHPELRIDGFIKAQKVLSKRYSSNPEKDRFVLQADDDSLIGNGFDATRVEFFISDQFGAKRPFASGKVSFKIEGPGSIIGDNPFDLNESGGAGAVWVKSQSHTTGTIVLQATHSHFGVQTIRISVQRETDI